MPGRSHHSQKMRVCVDQLIAKGTEKDSAYAICTASLKKAGTEIFEAAENLEARNLHLLGATGQPRVEQFNGRDHLVVPCVALMETVIHAVNSKVPELVPRQTLEKAASSWDNKPVVLGHPVNGNGRQISANDPAVLASHGIGTIRNSRMSGQKLLMDAYLDPIAVEKLGGSELLQRMRAGTDHTEVSVGAFVQAESTPGSFQGKNYKAIWRESSGDHLAFLVHKGARGACSVENGCGAHRAAMHLVTAESIDLVEPEALSNPEGINQYTYEYGGARFEAKRASRNADTSSNIANSRHGKASNQEIADKHSEAAIAHSHAADVHVAAAKIAKTSVTKDYHHAVAEGHRAKGEGHANAAGIYASIKTAEESMPEEKKTIRQRVMEIIRGASDGPAEEAAELVQYKTIQALLTQCGDSYDEAMTIVKELIADEAEGTLSQEEEAAEEEIESARLESINAHCLQMMGSLSGIMNVTRALLADDQDPAYPRYMEAADGVRALVGKRHSAGDQEMLQTVHDHSVSLGADCPMNRKLEEGDDTMSERALGGPGSGWTAENGHTPGGSQGSHQPHLKVRATELSDKANKISENIKKGEATHQDASKAHLSAANAHLKASIMPKTFADLDAHVQSAHEHLEKRNFHNEQSKNIRHAEESELKAAASHNCQCGSDAAHTGEPDMTKVERIQALMKNGGYTDAKWLETAPDEVLTALEAKATSDATIKAAAEKSAADLKAAQDASTKAQADNAALEVRLKAAEANMIPTDELTRLRAMAAAKQVIDTARHAELVTVLKTAQSEYTEDELKKESLANLERFARMAKVVEPDHSGRIVPRAAADGTDVFLNPPDGYQLALAARKSAVN